LDNTKQQAALETARRRVAEVDAELVMARADISAAEGQIQAAKGSLQQAIDELDTKEELQRRNAGIVATRDIEKLRNVVSAREGTLTATNATLQAAETRLQTVLPAEKASAEAARAQAQVDLDKTVVYAGVAGRVEQFVLRVGDVVNPLMRPAGILVPAGAGQSVLVAGFGQIERQVMQPGMAAEVTCASKPWTVIPMVVTQVQDYVAAGQLRTSEQLVDAQQVTRPGTLTVFLEPMFAGGLDGVIPGSSCIANAYSNNHDALHKPDIGWGSWLFLHMVDTVALVHAMILRLQALVFPIKTLVLSGH
jgi:multidrug resistance efflux pump